MSNYQGESAVIDRGNNGDGGIPWRLLQFIFYCFCAFKRIS